MERRHTAVGLIAAGMALSLLGTFSHAWFVQSGIRLHLGLREVELCASECHTMSLQDIPVGDLFTMMGNVAFFAPLIAGALAAVAALLALNRAVVSGPISPARLAAGFYAGGALAAIVFLAEGPEGAPGLDIGWSALAGLAGAVLAGAGAILLAIEERRAARPFAAEPPAPLPPARML